MLKILVNSTVLAAAVVLPMSFAACERSTNDTASTPPTGAGQRAGQAVDNAANNARETANNAANNAREGTNTAANNAREAANRTANSANNAANNAANSANNAANNAANTANNVANNPNNANNGSTAGPGMPSVQGTSTSDMTTADAAAQRLIDNARSNLKDNDVSKAKTLLTELKDKGMYDKLSVAQRANVDQLEKDINAATASGTAQENR